MEEETSIMAAEDWPVVHRWRNKVSISKATSEPPRYLDNRHTKHLFSTWHHTMLVIKAQGWHTSAEHHSFPMNWESDVMWNLSIHVKMLWKSRVKVAWEQLPSENRKDFDQAGRQHFDAGSRSASDSAGRKDAARLFTDTVKVMRILCSPLEVEGQRQLLFCYHI